MGEDDKKELSFPSLNLPVLPSVVHSSGMATPPLQTLASVPFKWEEEPGKPRPCTDIIPLPEPIKPRCLELPPSRLMKPADKMTKLPSPTAVLDWSDNAGRPRFSSFRFFKEAHISSSFDSSSSSGSPGSALDLLLSQKSGGAKKRSGFFGSAMGSRSVRKETDNGGSFGVSLSFTTVCERCKKVVKVEEKMRRNGSISRLTQVAAGPTHLWVSLRESLKQAIPWKSSRKSRKEGSI